MKCPRCQTRNHAAAKFCGRCGRSLAIDSVQRENAFEGRALREAGEQWPEAKPVPDAEKPLRHPTPLMPPAADFKRIDGMPDLYYRWESAWGGVMLLGTETIAVILFNGGYAMEDLTLDVVGQDTFGAETCRLSKELDVLPRGREVRFEVPSYELDGAASQLTVTIRSGRYRPER